MPATDCECTEVNDVRESKTSSAAFADAQAIFSQSPEIVLGS